MHIKKELEELEEPEDEETVEPEETEPLCTHTRTHTHTIY